MFANAPRTMGRALTCFRYCLIIDTVFLGISGAIVSIFSAYFIYKLHEYAPLTPNNVCGSSATLLAMGVITCGIGWFAWLFLNFSNRAQVIIFAVALAAITLTQISVGIWALVRHEKLDVSHITQHKDIIALAITDEKPIWDHMQSSLQCCGIDGSSDYQHVAAIPYSCCNTNIIDDNNVAGACLNIYKRGCQHVVLNQTKSILLYVFLLALASVILQIFFIVCTTSYLRIHKDRMERTRLEIAKRLSLQNGRELDTKDNLLSNRSILHSTRVLTPAVHNYRGESQKTDV